MTKTLYRIAGIATACAMLASAAACAGNATTGPDATATGTSVEGTPKESAQKLMDAIKANDYDTVETYMPVPVNADYAKYYENNPDKEIPQDTLLHDAPKRGITDITVSDPTTQTSTTATVPVSFTLEGTPYNIELDMKAKDGKWVDDGGQLYTKFAITLVTEYEAGAKNTRVGNTYLSHKYPVNSQTYVWLPGVYDVKVDNNCMRGEWEVTGEPGNYNVWANDQNVRDLHEYCSDHTEPESLQ